MDTPSSTTRLVLDVVGYPVPNPTSLATVLRSLIAGHGI